MKNQIVWCDIPVGNLDRALKFYSAVLDAKIEKQSFPGCVFGLLGRLSGLLAHDLLAHSPRPVADRARMPCTAERQQFRPQHRDLGDCPDIFVLVVPVGVFDLVRSGGSVDGEDFRQIL